MATTHKAYKFRLYPSKKQEFSLNKMLELARFAYNKQLELKIHAYQKENKNLTHFDLNNGIHRLKEAYPSLKEVHSQVLQNINQRISYAFQNFYRNIKTGRKAGFPRYKGKFRYDSLTYPQSGFRLEKKLFISKVGGVAIVKHRELSGKIKNLIIKRTSTNKWYACFSVEKESVKKLSGEQKSIGIDLGLANFYATSEGDTVEHPRYLRKAEQKLAFSQRKHSRKKLGSNNRKKSRLKVAKLHEKVVQQRLDFLHKTTRRLANNYAYIAVEKLHIQNMLHHPYLAKSISDASWHKFIQLLSYKVEETGGKLVGVNPNGTSQYCICGSKVAKSLAVRVHKCHDCGRNIDRDVMSAMLIKQKAFDGTTAGSAESNAWGDERMLSSMNQEFLASKG
ncbi:MAG: RNA-guided endonuclease TnpB family protein [Nanoarchaeota archaeon]|nr:RNA-guided endonuclease TnpB family protein [Nanoarchaeota archaeon]